MSSQKTTTSQKSSGSLREATQRFLDPEFRRQFSAMLPMVTGLLGGRIAQPLNLDLQNQFANPRGDIFQQAVSSGVENIRAQQGAQDRGLAQALSIAGTGDNTAQLAGLRRAAQISGAGAENALVPAALEQQRQHGQVMSAQAQAQNQARLQARNQLVNEVLPFINILDQLRGAAIAGGGERTRRDFKEQSSGTSKTRGGIFSLF